MAVSFDRIIAPMDRTRFFDDFWTKRAVLLEDPGRAFDDIFGWHAVDAILNATDLTFPKIKVSRSDRPAPAESFTSEAGGQRFVNGASVLALFKEGASVGITGADADWPPLRGVVDGMFDALLEQVHANVYCSPANTQGFQCHFDLHEVFVLQIDGAKRWRVFEPTVPFPTTSWKPEDAPAASAPRYVDAVLRKGDVLYVPRGHWHYAVAEDTASLHITVGVTCRKGSSFLDWLVGQAAGDALWGRNLPLVADAARGGTLCPPDDWTAYVGALRRALLDRLDDPDLAVEFCRAVLRDVSPRGTVSFSASATGGRSNADGIVFARPAGRRHVFERRDGAVVLVSGGCEIELEAGEVPFFQKVFATETFTAEEARAWGHGMDDAERQAVLGELARSGLLVVTDRHGAR